MKFTDRWFSVLHAAKSLRQIAESLSALEKLYRLDLQSRGIVEPQKDLSDEVEIMYGPGEASRPEEID